MVVVVVGGFISMRYAGARQRARPLLPDYLRKLCGND